MSKGVAPVILWLLVSVNVALGCECSNSTPIQQTSAQYRDRAVFTAHVIQLVGRTYDFKNEPRRMSSSAFAVVKQRYWGLPWYWPKIVLLDGAYPCEIAMAEGEDYLVSGQRVRYGVLAVNLCSRTQPLKGAEIDLRTLDGSRCAGPGGTLIGGVLVGRDPYRNPRIPDMLLTLRDQDGNEHSTRSDATGTYELQHLPAGDYTLDSRFSQSEYLSSQDLSVAEGTCLERHVLVRTYDFSGRAAPGLEGDAEIKLMQSDDSTEIRSDSLEPDGRFYFSSVPDGEYLLMAKSWIAGATNNFYYPGTFDPKKAAHIKVVNHKPTNIAELDFDLHTWQLVPLLVAPDPPNSSGRYSWRVQLINSDYVNNEKPWTPGEKAIRLYAARDASYKVVLYGYSNRPTDYGNCVSDPASITAEPGLIVHVKIPASCQ